MNAFDMAWRIALLMMGFLLFWKVPSFKPLSGQTTLHSVSLIVPVRNEVHRITPLLKSLKPYRDRMEILFIDDQSTDGSAAFIQREGFKVLSLTTLPSSWRGKPHAMDQGVQHTSGAILLFLDADTWLQPNGLETILERFEALGQKPLSIFPFHHTTRWYEHFTGLFDLTVLLLSQQFTLWQFKRPSEVLFGPCHLMRRTDYLAVGGYASVKSSVLEDIALGNRFKQHGIRHHALLGQGMISFRMYPEGVRSIIAGWSKNIGTGFIAVKPWILLLTIVWIATIFGATVVQPLSLFSGGSWPWVLSFYALAAFQLTVFQRRINRAPWWMIFFYPIESIFFTAVVLYSLIRTFLFRRVAWKGRSIKL